MNATKTQAAERKYRATLFSKAPYPLNWDSISEMFDTLEGAMERVAEWQKRYPKGLAKGGGRHIQVDSWAGEITTGYGSDGYTKYVGRKINFDSRKAR